MLQPFDVTLGDIDYAVFPEGEDTYVIFKDGQEHLHIQKDTELQWIKLDPKTGMPLFDTNDEVNLLGKEILAHIAEVGDDQDDTATGFVIGEEEED